MMRRRESVTTSPPPGLQSLKDPVLKDILRDVYDHLYVEATASTTEASAGAWHDRGDAAAVDFDEGDLTMDGNWHDLDLSDIIDSGAGWVVLRVVYTQGLSSAVSFGVRHDGDSNAVNIGQMVASASAAQDVLVAPSAAGVIEYRCSFTGAASDSIDITVAGWFA